MRSRERNPSPGSAVANLVDLFELIFGESSGQYALGAVKQTDLFTRGITGERDADLWRAWRDAWQLFTMSRLRDAQHRLLEAIQIHPYDRNSVHLVDIEISALNARILTVGNLPVDALNAWDDANKEIIRFASVVHDQPARAAGEIRQMLRYIAGLQQLDEKVADKEVVESWLVGRGVPLLLETFEQAVGIVEQFGTEKDAARIAFEARQNLNQFCAQTGLELNTSQRIKIEFSLGNILTPVDPERALQCFEEVINLASDESDIKFVAIFNSANCLLALHRYREAAVRYEEIESYFEMTGKPSMGARVWMAGCLARWRQTGDLSIRHSLRGAIQYYEENLPEDADYKTLYSLKRFVEVGYQLLIRLLAQVKRPTEEDLNDLLSVLWAMLSRDFAANLPSRQTEEQEEVTWEAVLNHQTQSLAMARNMLSPFPGTAVVHLFYLPDRVKQSEARHLPPNYNVFGMVWFLYGFDRAGNFRFEASVMPIDQSPQFRRLMDTMETQLAADLAQDAIKVQRLQEELVRIGDLLGRLLSQPFREALSEMSHLYYMPHPFEDVDEFPLQCLRLNNEWFGARWSITRASTINQLREMLSANNRRVQPNVQAVIVVGNPKVGVNRLSCAEGEADRVEHYVNTLGFQKTRHSDSSCTDMLGWLGGGAGLVHYIGHGLANRAYEGLPLGGEELFSPIDLDNLNPARTPFVFLCACEAARVRYGMGGYQIGLASKLLEKGAPCVLAFNLPIPEDRAYRIAKEFYRQSYRRPFGEAVRELRAVLSSELPTYAWLALVAYGDPDFFLPAVSVGDHVPSVSDRAISWHTILSAYAVLRTPNALNSALETVTAASAPLDRLARQLLEVGFKEPPASSKEILTQFENEALKALAFSEVGVLTLRSAILIERAHLAGLDATPMRPPSTKTETKDLYTHLNFVASASFALNDLPLSGVACALLGRLLTWNFGNLEYSQKYLQHALEALRGCEQLSPYVERMRRETVSIIHQFGGRIEE